MHPSRTAHIRCARWAPPAYAAPAVVAAAAGVAGRDDSRAAAPARGLVAFALLRRNRVAQSPGSRSRQWMRRMHAHMRLMPGSRCRQWMMRMHAHMRLMHSYPRRKPRCRKEKVDCWRHRTMHRAAEVRGDVDRTGPADVAANLGGAMHRPMPPKIDACLTAIMAVARRACVWWRLARGR